MYEVHDPDSETARRLDRVFVSARTGEGLPQLREMLARHAGAFPQADSPQADEAVV
jgi:GTP-binding protein HflX